MEYDKQPSPERVEELPEPAFNLEQLEPNRVAELIGSIGYMIDYSEQIQQGSDITRDGLLRLLGRDQRNLPARNLPKAIELWNTLVRHEDPWAKMAAADYMGEALWQQEELKGEERQQVLESWLALLKEEHDDEVTDMANHTLSRAIDAGVFDDQMARFINEQLHEGFQILSWLDEDETSHDTDGEPGHT